MDHVVGETQNNWNNCLFAAKKNCKVLHIVVDEINRNAKYVEVIFKKPTFVT